VRLGLFGVENNIKPKPIAKKPEFENLESNSF